MRGPAGIAAVACAALAAFAVLGASAPARARAAAPALRPAATTPVLPPQAGAGVPAEAPQAPAEQPAPPAAPETVPVYIHPVWLALFVAAVLLWLYAVAWVSADARGVGASHELITAMMLAIGPVGLLSILCVHGAFSLLMVAMVLAACAGYVSYRNKLVPEAHRIFGPHQRAALLARLPLRAAPTPAAAAGAAPKADDFALTNSMGETLDAVMAAQPTLAEAVGDFQSAVLRAFVTRCSELRVFAHEGQYLIQAVKDGQPYVLEAVPADRGPHVVGAAAVFMGLAEGGRVRQGESQLFADTPGQKSVTLGGRVTAVAGKPAVVVEMPDWTADLPRQGLEALGMHEALIKRVKAALEQRTGAIIIGGPPKSGKTATLYAITRTVDIFTTDVIAIEAVQEHELEQVRRWPFSATALFGPIFTAIMREAPQAIMFGEIARPEEARLLLHFAKQDGKLITVVPAPSGPAALVRLVGMAGNPALVADGVICALSQRLVRKLCVQCREAVQPDPDYLRKLGMDPSQPGTWFRALGCPECLGSGYSGRTAIFSMLILTDPVKAALAVPGATARSVTDAAGQVALRTLQQDGMTKVAAGVTTFEEVRRVVAGDDESKDQKEGKRT